MPFRRLSVCRLSSGLLYVRLGLAPHFSKLKMKKSSLKVNNPKLIKFKV